MFGLVIEVILIISLQLRKLYGINLYRQIKMTTIQRTRRRLSVPVSRIHLKILNITSHSGEQVICSVIELRTFQI